MSLYSPIFLYTISIALSLIFKEFKLLLSVTPSVAVVFKIRHCCQITWNRCVNVELYLVLHNRTTLFFVQFFSSKLVIDRFPRRRKKRTNTCTHYATIQKRRGFTARVTLLPFHTWTSHKFTMRTQVKAVKFGNREKFHWCTTTGDSFAFQIFFLSFWAVHQIK